MSDPSPARLLIVDDEVRQMNALCDTLRDQNYEVTGYSSSREALAALPGQKYDLLLTDLMMPEMDGIALLQAAHEVDPDLVSIVMTGHATIDTAVDAMKAGALDYIQKPFKLSVVLPVLARALTVRRLRLENAALEKRVRERTEALEVANRELEVANKELEAFSYSVSHDLRTPLRHIEGFAQLLESGYATAMPDPAKGLLTKVLAGAARMGLLIDELLNLSRMSRQPLIARTVKLSTLVQEVLNELEPERAGRQIELHVDPLPDCQGDATLLKQVFANLLGNAVKFTGKKEVAVIEVRCVEEGEDWRISVSDNGAGFDMQYAERLFGVFQRLHKADQFEGTGIGLSIVQRIVHRHGGRIWAEAELGKGAKFIFTLPKKGAAAGEAAPVSASAVEAIRRQLVPVD